MKKLLSLFLAAFLVLSLCSCGPKQYEDLSESEKKIVDAASNFHAEYPAAQNVTLAGNPHLFIDYEGNEYVMLPLKFTENGVEEQRGVDIKNGHLVGFGAVEITDPEGIIDNSPEGIQAAIEGRAIWDAYIDTIINGGDIVGMTILDGTLRIASVEEFKKKDLEEIINACFNP